MSPLRRRAGWRVTAVPAAWLRSAASNGCADAAAGMPATAASCNTIAMTSFEAAARLPPRNTAALPFR